MPSLVSKARAPAKAPRRTASPWPENWTTRGEKELIASSTWLGLGVGVGVGAGVRLD